MTRLGMMKVGVLVLVIAGCSDDGVPSTGSDTIEADTNATNEGGSETGDGTASSTAGSTASSTATSVGESTGGTTDDPGSTEAADSSGSDTGPLPPSACMTDDDCVLVNDCCTCAAIGVDVDPPECAQDCEVGMCDALGLGMPAVRCELGFCEIAGADCNGVAVTCDQAPPKCGPGELPSVDEGCWTGYCLPVELCDTVNDCADCPEGTACVEYQSFTVDYRCAPMPDECGGTPSCACMGEVCQDPFNACGETPTGIGCACPAC